MKFLVLVFVQLLVVHIAWSAVSQGGNFTNPDHPGKCYYKEEDSDSATILSPGEEVTIKGKCALALCYWDFSMRLESCGLRNGPKENYIPANYSLPYPKCCPSYRSKTIDE